MKKKINLEMCLISFIATCLTAIFVTVSFYQANTERTWKQLEDVSRIYASEYNNLEDIQKMSVGVKDHYRITLIEPDGSVAYDNQVDPEKLDNHMERQEVVKAKQEGKAMVVRTSDTVGKNTYYYALDLGQNRILRIGEDTDTVMTTFLSVIPLIVGVAFCAFVLCFWISTHLTNKIVKPIQQMAEGKIEVPYEELQPFARSIKERVAMEKMKQEFTANVSHELKTPLTSISGYAELIENGMARDEDITTFATKIHTEAGRLIGLIADIMKLSELEEPGSVCEFLPVKMKDIIQETVASLEILAHNKGVKFQVLASDEMILGDRKLLSEVVYNLCDNAIRYNKDNGVVTVFLGNQEEQGTILTVEDTGIGIDSKNYDNIFRRFYRVDKSRSKETGGTGLGLAIVKHIAELHGAEITIESELGKGTKISVLFPNIEGGREGVN